MATAATDRKVPILAPARLPYHPAVQERFGIDQASWRALTESLYPAAQTSEAIILVLSYCRARNLDPFKKPVHIVPIWDKKKGREVETVWPGIAEFRTTAFRTGEYAGHDATVFGPEVEDEWTDEKTGHFTVRFPEWAQVTVYRTVKGERCAFPGARVYWRETFATARGGVPNSMWRKRPHGQIDKCAEAAALRAAFPEELGGEEAAEEVGGFTWHGRAAIAAEPTGTRSEQLIAKLTPQPPAPVPEPAEDTPAGEPDETPGDPQEETVAGPESTAEAPADSDQQSAEQAALVADYEGLLEDSRSEGELSAWEAKAKANKALTETGLLTVLEAVARRRQTLGGKPATLPPRRGRPAKSGMFPDPNAG